MLRSRSVLLIGRTRTSTAQVWHALRLAFAEGCFALASLLARPLRCLQRAWKAQGNAARRLHIVRTALPELAESNEQDSAASRRSFPGSHWREIGTRIVRRRKRPTRPASFLGNIPAIDATRAKAYFGTQTT